MAQPIRSSLGDAIRDRATGIDIANVSLAYGQTQVLKGVNLSIRPGEMFAFLGPSGCGKTTLLRLIAGFNTAQAGTIRLGGQDISALPPWERDVGMVFQSYALWPHMSVARNVAFGLEERRLPRDEIAARVDQALDLVGMRHLKDRKPAQLSGGQQQRVALARTIAVRPKVLLLDEPLSNLDARMRVQVRRELRELQQALGITTIFVTHDQEEANTMCDRIALMHDGVVQQVDTPMALYDRPANLFVAGFLGTANALPGRPLAGRDGATVFSIAGGGQVPVPAGQAVSEATKFVFRPQNATIVAAGSPPQAAQTRIAGQVAHAEFLGGTIRYGVALDDAEVLVDVPHQAGSAPLAAGTPVALDIDHARGLFLKHER